MKKVAVTCIHCGKQTMVSLSAFSRVVGSMTSPKKARASRRNGQLGGRPKRVGPPILPPNEHGL